LNRPTSRPPRKSCHCWRVSSNLGTSTSSSMSITCSSVVLFFFGGGGLMPRKLQGHNTVYKYHICLFLLSVDYTHILNPNEYSQKAFSRSQ
jgi:hypothetical protein